MSNEPIGSALQLPDLFIENFRGIKSLTIPRLGRVTLVAGQNGVGKSTVLDAVKVYAARARFSVLRAILSGREEIFISGDDEADQAGEPDWEALFYGRDGFGDAGISIGPTRQADRLRIEAIDPDDVDVEQARLPGLWPDDATRVLKVTFQGIEVVVPAVMYLGDVSTGSTPRRTFRQQGNRILRAMGQDFEHTFQPIACESLGPGLLGNPGMARFWDRVALTDYQSKAVEALGLAFGGVVEGVTMIAEENPRRPGGRRAIAKLEGYSRPVPLKSLGDGALRLFSVALALANSRAGFLVIDEAENGIHHSVQRSYWRMVLQTAQENNVQVIATTHSWDCVRGFAQAATELEDVEGALVRLERRDGALRAVQYSEVQLQVAAEQGIEVR